MGYDSQVSLTVARMLSDSENCFIPPLRSMPLKSKKDISPKLVDGCLMNSLKPKG